MPQNSSNHAVSAPKVVPRRVLIVEDNDLGRRHLQKLLQVDPDVQIESCEDGRQALQMLKDQAYSVAIMDLRLPGLDGMELIKEIQALNLPVTTIVTTGQSSIDEAVKALRLGAYDFLTKPIDIDNLRSVLRRALRDRDLQDEVALLRERLQREYSFHNVLSKNPKMHALFELISNVGSTNSTVLVEGETGTGKEQIARAIHQVSQNRAGPLVAVNCAALPENLLESELFGHEKGAFTSAVSQRQGRFEMANGGTLFLDEVGDIPPTMQAKLLRVLQERQFERVGGTATIEVDVRVIGATNRSLKSLVRKGKFREDLYYRLNVVRMELPPLRDRPEDIPLLATHFIEKYRRNRETAAVLAPDALELLLNYPWPGNIRELENAIERACITTRDNEITAANLPPEIVAPSAPKTPFKIDIRRPLPEILRTTTAEIEERYLRLALQKSRGNVARCAKICGLSRRSITSKLAEYKLDKAVFKDA